MLYFNVIIGYEQFKFHTKVLKSSEVCMAGSGNRFYSSEPKRVYKHNSRKKARKYNLFSHIHKEERNIIWFSVSCHIYIDRFLI